MPIFVSAGFMMTSVLCFLSLVRAYRVFVQVRCCLVKYEYVVVCRPILFLFGQQCTLLKWAFVNILECKLHNSISVTISFVCVCVDLSK